MEQYEIQELIAHPERLSTETLLFLRKLVARYPYFQTAWILYLKNLFVLSDPNFKDELRRGALFVADLSVLFYYIEGERFLIKRHGVEDGNSEISASDRTLDLIDRFLSEKPEQPTLSQAVPEISIPLEMSGDYTSVLLSEVTENDEQPSPLNGQELIDQFIQKSEVCTPDSQKIHMEMNPTKAQDKGESMSPPSDEACINQENSSDEQEEVEENYFTETLAKIYVRQQRYDKALEIIKKLNLKYPKKNAYFADQIRFLEKLIINAKSK